MPSSYVSLTYQSLVTDMVRKSRHIQSEELQVLLHDLFNMVRHGSDKDIVEVYPVLSKSFDKLLACGECPDEMLRFKSVIEADIANEQSTSDMSLFVYLVRQTLGFYSRLTTGKVKTQVPWTPYRSSSDSSVDEEVLTACKRRLTTDTCGVLPPSVSLILEVVLEAVDLTACQDLESDFPFRHGPGVVAESFKNKGLVRVVHDPSFDWVSPSPFRVLFPENEDVSPELGRYDPKHGCALKGAEASRVMLVPKDYRGPRVIAAEPILHQYVQLGIATVLEKSVRRSAFRDVVDIRDQETSRSLALEASKTGSHVTIDLKDASDLVKVWHVQGAFRRLPNVLPYLMAARTRKCLFPDGDEVEISTFAPMGSGLCFIIESLVFAAICLGATWPRARRVTAGSVRNWARVIGLRCYGDDIIVKHEYSDIVMQALIDAQFITNKAKTCVWSRFRESCGCDAYGGTTVTTMRPRLLPGASSYTFASLVDNLRNALRHGNYSLAKVLAKIVRDCAKAQGIKVQFHVVSDGDWYATCPWVYPLPDSVFGWLAAFDVTRARLISSRVLTVVKPRMVPLRIYPEEAILRSLQRGSCSIDDPVDTHSNLKASAVLSQRRVRLPSGRLPVWVYSCKTETEFASLLDVLILVSSRH